MEPPLPPLPPLLLLLLLSCSGVTSADQTESVVVKVKEGSDAILPCSLSTKQNIRGELFNWRKVVQKDVKEVFEYDAGSHYNNGRQGQDNSFKGRVSHFPEQLEFSNASIKIRNTVRSDSGNYTCEFPNLKPNSQTFHIKLVVDCSNNLKDRSEENIPGTCPKPSVTSLDDTQYWELLYCEVLDAFPEPEVKWQDSAGNNLPDVKTQVTEREGHYYITLQTNVTKTGRYYCVATQLDICHKLSANISVYITGPVPTHKAPEPTHTGSSTGLVVAVVILSILLVVVLLAVLYNKRDMIQKFMRVSDQSGHSTVDINHPGVDKKDEATEKLNETVTQM